MADIPTRRLNLDTKTPTNGHLQGKERSLGQNFPNSPEEEPVLYISWTPISRLEKCDKTNTGAYAMPLANPVVPG